MSMLEMSNIGGASVALVLVVLALVLELVDQSYFIKCVV